MKKIILSLGLLIALCGFSNAQTFWFENWSGTSCASLCTTYTGSNGAWTSAATGSNGAAANVWYFSNKEQALGRGVCGTMSGSHPTAHVGNVSTSPQAYIYCPTGDCGAWADVSPGSPSDVTNTRLESPVIDCSNKSTITLSFNYITSTYGATIDYYNDSTWSVLETVSTPITAPCFSTGAWYHSSVALPASANNNAHVQIGFNWSCDTLQYYDTVSFAVDSISLSGTTTSGVNTLSTYNNFKVYPNPNNGIFTIQMVNSEMSKGNNEIQVYNILGEKVFSEILNSAQSNNNIDLSGEPNGVYLYKVFTQQGDLAGIGKLIIQK